MSDLIQHSARFEYGELYIAFEGSREFVEAHWKLYAEPLLLDLKKSASIGRKEITNRVDEKKDEVDKSNNRYNMFSVDDLPNFPSLLEVNNDTIHLKKSLMPGKSQRQKMLTTTFLFLYALRVYHNRTLVNMYEVREFCNDYHVYDVKNFKNMLRTNKEYFVIEGRGKEEKIRLTDEGVLKAIEIADAVVNKP